jgi:uncharacterized protein YjdB
VTAVGAGTASITATVDGVAGSATVTVTVRPVARVDVQPSTFTMNTGEKKQFTAITYDADGGVLTGRSCSWTSDHTTGPPVLTVDSETGQVNAKRKGTSFIFATCESKTDSAMVTVKD